MYVFSGAHWQGSIFTQDAAAPAVSRGLLVVGSGPLGQSVSKQIQRMASENFSLVGFVSDGYDDGTGILSLGRLNELKDVIQKHSITDVVIALPYSVYHKMSEIVLYLEKLPVGVWVALGFFDLALYRTNIEDFAGLPMLDLRASCD